MTTYYKKQNKGGRMNSMLDDIKMWLYLRLLQSELHEHIKPVEGSFGDTTDFEEKKRRFRYKENFMKKVQVLGMPLWFVWLPYKFHKFFLKGTPEIENIEINYKINDIFNTAEKLKLIEHPTKQELNPNFYSVMNTPEFNKYEDKKEIAISYNLGSRFVSWSGLISFLYNNHWQFVAILWTVILYVTGNVFGIFSYIFEHLLTR